MKLYTSSLQKYSYLFVEMKGLCESQIINLLETFDIAYGNTDQELSIWASEYQVLTRMLLHHHALMVNPHYLNDDILPILKRIFSDSGKDWEIFEFFATLSQATIKQIIVEKCAI